MVLSFDRLRASLGGIYLPPFLFNSLTRIGRDQKAVEMMGGFQISIHALVESATEPDTLSSTFEYISIHALV